MKLTEPLTKANFWDLMQKKYPKAFESFSQWIDEYKMAVNWNALFNEKKSFSPPFRNMGTLHIFSEAPKFHDLPFGFQQGIWLEYLAHLDEFEFMIKDFSVHDLRKDIEVVFRNLEFQNNRIKWQNK